MTSSEKIDFIDGDRWMLINRIRACSQFKYGEALLAVYPGLRDNALGNGSADSLRLLRDGIFNRSQPMCLAALLANAPLEVTETEKTQLDWLMLIAASDRDLSFVFEEECDF